MTNLLDKDALLESYRKRIDTLEAELEIRAAEIRRLQTDARAKDNDRSPAERTLRALDIHFPSIHPL